jgi:catechol 2,3-dioxygenase-like lactoylglutathione lyase family enzyme
MKKRSGEPWMPAPDYGRSLKGFNVNVVVREIAPALAFQTEVLGVRAVYSDEDIAVLRHDGQDWMLHADHTYIDETAGEHPFLQRCAQAAPRGAGVELRLYGIDPDAAEARARARGDPVLAPSRDKPHGLRECHLVDPDGYVWVPGIALSA